MNGCPVGACPDRATHTVRFYYEGSGWVDVAMCGRHSWPWRSGRGGGQADVTPR